MTREAIRIKLLRMVAGQVKSYINDHPGHIHPAVIDTLPGSIAKRVANELFSKGVEIDPGKSTNGTIFSNPKIESHNYEIVHKKRRHSHKRLTQRASLSGQLTQSGPRGQATPRLCLPSPSCRQPQLAKV